MSQLLKRYLCWDEKLIENSENLQFISHKPERKNIAMRCDAGWEGKYGYASLVKTNDGTEFTSEPAPFVIICRTKPKTTLRRLPTTV
jgi:hypothetical protein